MVQSPFFHTLKRKNCWQLMPGALVILHSNCEHSFTSLRASFSLFSLDLRLDPLGLIWLAALAKKALLTSHSGSCGTQTDRQTLVLKQVSSRSANMQTVWNLKQTVNLLIRWLKVDTWLFMVIFSPVVFVCRFIHALVALPLQWILLGSSDVLWFLTEPWLEWRCACVKQLPHFPPLFALFASLPHQLPPLTRSHPVQTLHLRPRLHRPNVRNRKHICSVIHSNAHNPSPRAKTGVSAWVKEEVRFFAHQAF